MGRSKAPSLPIKALSFCRPTELRGWQRNWIHRGAPRPANPVTCFPPGKVVAPATKGGLHFHARQGGCMVFAAKGGIKNGVEGAVPRQRSDTIKLPRAEARSPSGRRQPVPDRTLGAQGQRPGGAINPRPRKRASTFGNTRKHRPSPDPDPDRATGTRTLKPRQSAVPPASH